MCFKVPSIIWDAWKEKHLSNAGNMKSICISGVADAKFKYNFCH